MSFDVQNTGKRAGAEVAQVYLGLPEGAGEPPKRLASWARVSLRPGQRRRVSTRIAPERLAIWDAERDRWKVPAGKYRVYVGASSRDLRLRDGFRLGAR